MHLTCFKIFRYTTPKIQCCDGQGRRSVLRSFPVTFLRSFTTIPDSRNILLYSSQITGVVAPTWDRCKIIVIPYLWFSSAPKISSRTLDRDVPTDVCQLPHQIGAVCQLRLFRHHRKVRDVQKEALYMWWLQFVQTVAIQVVTDKAPRIYADFGFDIWI
jgi:hypothetical protein